MIDIVVGGQYGDEGKGSICAHLVYENNYKFAVRVGGSNAEHRFRLPDNNIHTARVLPVAAWVDGSIISILGAGHMIKLSSFQKEMDELEKIWGPTIYDRVLVDEQAGVIADRHTAKSHETAFRGSTHQGNGQAVAHKVLRDGDFKLARDYSEFRPFLSNTVEVISNYLEQGETGILEGSQGVLLSLNHGSYPFNTAKDVTPAALLAEAGIPTRAVRHTYAVYRAIPMRVPGNSGPVGDDSRELRWYKLEKAIGQKFPDESKKQTDSGNYERVFTWSWKDFKKSVALIGPNYTIITFMDWWATELFEEKSKSEFLRKVMKTSDCPIYMVRSGPYWDDHGYFPKI